MAKTKGVKAWAVFEGNKLLIVFTNQARAIRYCSDDPIARTWKVVPVLITPIENKRRVK